MIPKKSFMKSSLYEMLPQGQYRFNFSLVPVPISSVTEVSHNASTEGLHSSLSATALHTSVPDFQPASFLSFSTVRFQVVFGRPLLRLPSGARVISLLIGFM